MSQKANKKNITCFILALVTVGIMVGSSRPLFPTFSDETIIIIYASASIISTLVLFFTPLLDGLSEKLGVDVK